MSRKDYIVFAQMLRGSRRMFKSNNGYHMFVAMVADIFEADNKNFSRQRFVEACRMVADFTGPLLKNDT